MTTLRITLVFFSLLAINTAFAQNYQSVSDGSWTTAAKWNNTSGWGTSTPPTDGSQGSGTITMQNNMTVTGAYGNGSATLNVSAGKTMTVTGNFTTGGGGTVNVYGTLVVNGNITLNSNIFIMPGGTVIVVGNMTVVSSAYLNVGTSANPPPYADLVVENNLILQGSGDATLNKNARVAVYKNVTDDGSGGTFLKLNAGAQMYVNGNIALTGGGDDIINSNGTTPIGLYVNGNTNNSGGGSTTTSNKGTKAQMQTNDPTFYTWVSSQPSSPLPVTLTYFKVGSFSASEVILDWMTASEINFDHFEVLKSTDGENFSIIGTVNGHGTTTEKHTYTFVDASPVIGKNYYRLKSVDFDGYVESFNIVMAEIDANKQASIYPNPVLDHELHIDLNFEPPSETHVSIYDLTGFERLSILTKDIQIIAPIALPQGTYIVKVTNGDFARMDRIIVK